MKQLYDFVSQPLGQLLLWGASALLALALYFRAKREKLPTYAYESLTLVEGLSKTLADLSVIYAGKAQERITVTKVFFWNAGRETIRRSDLTNDTPLRIEMAPGAEVLSCITTYSSDAASKFQHSEIGKSSDGSTTVPLHFEFLDYKEGGVVQIVHTGHASHKITVEGKVIGTRQIRHVVSARNKSLSDYRTEFSFMVLGAVVFMSFLLVKVLWEEPTSIALWVFTLVCLGIMGFYMLFWYAIRTIPAKLIRGRA